MPHALHTWSKPDTPRHAKVASPLWLRLTPWVMDHIRDVEAVLLMAVFSLATTLFLVSIFAAEEVRWLWMETALLVAGIPVFPPFLWDTGFAKWFQERTTLLIGKGLVVVAWLVVSVLLLTAILFKAIDPPFVVAATAGWFAVMFFVEKKKLQ